MAATLITTIPLVRRACSPAPMLTPRSHPGPDAEMRSRLPLNPPANPATATSTSNLRTAGDEPYELRHVGSRFRAGRNAPAQTAEALRSHAHAPQRFPARLNQQPPGPDGD